MPTQCSFCHVLPINIRCQSSRPSKNNFNPRRKLPQALQFNLRSIANRDDSFNLLRYVFILYQIIPTTFSFIFIPFRLNLTFLYAISSLCVVNYFIVNWNQCKPQNRRRIQVMLSCRLEKECN